MSIFLYIIGMYPAFLCVHNLDAQKGLSVWAKAIMIVAWPIAYFITAIIFLWFIWADGRRG